MLPRPLDWPSPQQQRPPRVPAPYCVARLLPFQVQLQPCISPNRPQRFALPLRLMRPRQRRRLPQLLPHAAPPPSPRPPLPSYAAQIFPALLLRSLSLSAGLQQHFRPSPPQLQLPPVQHDSQLQPILPQPPRMRQLRPRQHSLRSPVRAPRLRVPLLAPLPVEHPNNIDTTDRSLSSVHRGAFGRRPA